MDNPYIFITTITLWVLSNVYLFVRLKKVDDSGYKHFMKWLIAIMNVLIIASLTLLVFIEM